MIKEYLNIQSWYTRKIPPYWEQVAWKLQTPDHDIEIIDVQYNRPNDVFKNVAKCLDCDCSMENVVGVILKMQYMLLD